MTPAQKTKLHPLLKFVLDIGPLVLFFYANSKPALFHPLVAPILPAAVSTGDQAGIFTATAVFMIAIVAALIISYVLTRHLPVMPVVTMIVVIVFGAATLYFHDETFIKLKPTIIYILFGGTLLIGQMLGKNFLSIIFDAMFHLTPKGWRKLTLRWAGFFLLLAVLNEIVWRTQTTDTWVNFKVFVVTGLTFMFAAAQVPLLTKHAAPAEEN